MTHDDIIARGHIWQGQILEVRQRMANYLVDGIRFGSIDWTTKSGLKHDKTLSKWASEVVTAAFIFSRLNHKDIRIVSKLSSGELLERPDLDVYFADGSSIGVEVADVSQTLEMKHSAGKNHIKTAIDTLLERDLSFHEIFGNYHVSVNLNPIGTFEKRPIGGKKEVRALLSEFKEFFLSGRHQQTSDRFMTSFSTEFASLHARGAEYNSSPSASGPYFVLGDGPFSGLPPSDYNEFIRILDKHRNSAATYRRNDNWIVLYLVGEREFLKNSVNDIYRNRPNITPFERCIVSDGAGRLIQLP